MFKIKLGNFYLDVDSDTFQSLQDPECAANYLKQIQKQFGKDNFENEPSNEPQILDSSKIIWTSSKKPTDRDIQACYAFLSLRKSLNDKFDDKKTSKNILWLEIANKMYDMGFFVGEGLSGREKCRQKFMNLQHSYMKYKDQSRQTGEGFVKKPQFFDEIDDILGDKHKSKPEFVLDSSRASSSHIETQEDPSKMNADEYLCQPSTSQSETQKKSEKPKINKFEAIKKSVRPKKSVLTTVENIIREERSLRTEQFKELIDVLKVQNQQRHEQTMGIIELLKKQPDGSPQPKT